MGESSGCSASWRWATWPPDRRVGVPGAVAGAHDSIRGCTALCVNMGRAARPRGSPEQGTEDPHHHVGQRHPHGRPGRSDRGSLQEAWEALHLRVQANRPGGSGPLDQAGRSGCVAAPRGPVLLAPRRLGAGPGAGDPGGATLRTSPQPLLGLQQVEVGRGRHRLLRRPRRPISLDGPSAQVHGASRVPVAECPVPAPHHADLARAKLHEVGRKQMDRGGHCEFRSCFAAARAWMWRFHGRLGVPTRRWSSGLVTATKTHPWPGRWVDVPVHFQSPGAVR